METTTSTKNQFKEISRLMDIQDLAKKISKLTKINYNRVLQVITNQDINDEQIYSMLHNDYKNVYSKETPEKKVVYRAGGLTDQLVNIIKNAKYNKNNLLDVGCGDCSITINFAKRLQIKNIPKCVDVKNWNNTYVEKDQNCAVRYTNGKYIPYPDKSMDIIIALHSIHHMKHAERMIKEISRVIKDNGLLIVREHDCQDESTKLFIDIIHSVYEMVMKENPNPNYLDTYYARYYSFKFLNTIFYKYGFELIRTTHDLSKMKNYMALYQKVK